MEIKTIEKIKRILTIALSFIFTASLSSCSFVEGCIESKTNRSYIIRFHANGGMGEMEDFFVESGKEGLLPEYAFIKEGYECLSWSTDKNGEDLYGYIQNLTFWLPSSVKNGDTVDLYAVWTTPGFTFEFGGIAFFSSATATSYNGSAKDVIVPAATNDIGYCDVSTIGPGVFAEHTEIESVRNFPTNDIASKLFYGCSSLKSVALRKGKGKIRHVRDQAFYNCSSLQELEFSTTSTITIGQKLFMAARLLKNS